MGTTIRTTDIIIPLAGEGKRFLALREYHKSLLPLKGVEVLRHILDSLIDRFEAPRFVFVVNYYRERVEQFIGNYFLDHAEIEHVSVLQEKEYCGPLAAIYYSLEWIRSENVLIHLGDVVLPTETPAVFRDDFLGVQCVSDFARWCMVDKQMNFYDKPSERPPTNMALNGLYFFTDVGLMKDCTKRVIESERPLFGDEYQLSQMLSKYTCQHPMILLEIPVTDIGNVDDFLFLNSYKRSRSFNVIKESWDTFTKASCSGKLIKEFYHARCLSDMGVLNIPRPITARVENGDVVISMENIRGTSVDYLYVFEDFDEVQFSKLFRDMISGLRFVIDKCQVDSVCQDLETVLFIRGYQDLERYVNGLTKTGVMSHGDYHLGNMIHANDRFYLVDPSGRFIHIKYYDLAKLVHGVIYDYHLVKFNLYKWIDGGIEFYNDHLAEKKSLFMGILSDYFDQLELAEAKTIAMILFKTMQPLHENKEHVRIFEAIHRALRNEIDEGDFLIHGHKRYQLVL